MGSLGFFLWIPICQVDISLDSHLPGLSFLKWLRNNCSNTEALGITLAFEDTPVHILYCYRHLWGAWDKNIKTKIVVKKCCTEDSAEIIQDIWKAARSPLRAEMVEEFDTLWAEIEMEWADQKA
ncbi:hypothetical protein K439DRAFT_1618822 [Ramaria rubella]|nr:hypothetical protein K439DRAFT_1618822 [Ramaria rubella]